MFNFIIVDFQKDFYDVRYGALGVPGADIALENILTFIEKHHEEIETVYLTCDCHPESHCSFIENGGNWPAHCVQNTEGARIHPDILNLLLRYSIDTKYLYKGENPEVEEYSAFATTNSNNTKIDYTNPYIICGLAGDFCVKETYQDLLHLLHGSSHVFMFTPGIASIIPGVFDKFIKDNNVITINN